MSIGDIVAIATLGVTIVGSILAYLLRRRSQSRKLKVDLRYGVLTGSLATRFGDSLMFILKVANSTNFDVSIRSLYLEWNKQQLVAHSMNGEKDLPFTLSKGENASFWIPVKNVKQALASENAGKAKISAIAEDAIGVRSKSSRHLILGK